MLKAFTPHRKWLTILPKAPPSDHYRLLPILTVAFVFTFASLVLPNADAESPKHKLPIPDAVAQEKAIAKIRDAYNEDYNSDCLGSA